MDETIKQALTISSTEPEEAAQNISRSNLFEVSPDAYKEHKDMLEPEAVAIERTPANVGKATKEYVQQSEQHASLAKKDLDAMSWMEGRAKYYNNKVFKIPELQREINELYGEKMNAPGGVIDKGTQDYIDTLNDEMMELEKENSQFDVGGVEGFAADVISAGGDMVRQYWENKELAAGIIGTSTLVGGGIGLATPVPGATVVGLSGGFAKGIVGASVMVGIVDGYTQTSRSMFRELDLATDDSGKPLNLPHDKKENISKAVGFLSGAASGLAGKLLTSNNPVLKKMLNPKLALKYVTNPAMMAKMDILGAAVKAIGSEGTEEGFQELIQIYGKHFGQMDETEGSFLNALSLTSEEVGQIAYSAAVGGATGAGVQTITSAPGYGKLKADYERINEVTKKKQEVLENQNNLLEIAQKMKDTNMQKLSPSEMTNFQKKMWSLMGVDENVWLHMEDMREFANSPEKAAAIRKIVDPTGEMTKMSQELNTPLQVSKAEFLQIMTEFPEVSDYMRMFPDGESPLDIRNEGKDFANRLKDAESRRDELLSSLGVDQEPTPEMQAELDKSLEPVKTSKYFSSRDQYMEGSTIQPMEGIVNEKEVEALSKAHLEARLEVDKAVVDPVNKRFEKYANEEFKMDTKEMIELEIKKLDREFSVIRQFEKPETEQELNVEFTKEHKKKGFSAFAIDPSSLSESQKIMYNSELAPSMRNNLKKRKAFVEGGIHVEEAAAIMGYENGEELLKVLAETPTRKQIETRIKNDPLRNAVKPQQIEESMSDTRNVARDEAFSNLTNVHLKEMKVMAEKNWATVKRGIIKIAKKVPTVAEINLKAKDTVATMKIRDLNERRYATGENRSQRAAVESFVAGRFEDAFVNKERAALNNEMRKETVHALEQVEKFQRFWKRVSKESNQQALKDAGMNKVMDDFMSLYKLDGNVRNEKEQQSFNKWVKAQEASGNFVPVVPDRLDNIQTSYKDLTVEQYKTISEMGQYILDQAKKKNKLISNMEKRSEILTTETIAEDIKKNTEAHWKFDPKKALRVNKDYMSKTDKLHKSTRTFLSTMASMKSIISELDEYKLNGYFHQLLGAPVKQARTNKRLEIAEIEATDKATIEKFYGSTDKFAERFFEFVNVPELDGVEGFGDNNGNIRKVDLMSVQAYLGDPDGRAALDNFRREGVETPALDFDGWRRVIETHLDENDVAFVQNFLVNRFERFKERSFALHKRTTGAEPEMVQGLPYVLHGKVMPGGYYPIKRQIVGDDVRASNLLDGLKENIQELGMQDESHFYARMRTAEMTQQGRMKDRTGSQRALDLDFKNVFDFTEEAVHDLNFREYGINALKILKDPSNVKNIKSVVGTEKFVNLLNSVKDVVSKTSEREGVLYGEENGMINQLIQKAHSVHAVQAIAFNATSAAVQTDSLANVVLRLGPKAGLYMAKQAYKIGKNLSYYNKFVEMAQEINKDIKLEQDNVDNAVVKHKYDFIPASTTFFKKYKTESGTRINKIRKMQQGFTDAGFYMVREMDKFNKVLVTLSTFEMYMNGDIEGHSKESIDKLSDAERAKAVRDIISQTSDLALTAAATEDRTPIEKNQTTKIFTRYFTDRRSRFNTILAQIDKTRGAIKRQDNAQAAKYLLTMSIAMGSSAAWIALIRNSKDSLFNRLKEEDKEDVALMTAWDYAIAPLDQFTDTIPGVDAMKYAFSQKGGRSDYRNVSTPLFGVMSNFVMGALGVKEVLTAAMKGKGAKLSRANQKAILTSMGYIAGGLPTNTMFKGYEALDNKYVKKFNRGLKDEMREVNETIDKYIEMFKDDPEAEEFIEGLKEYKQTLPQYESDVKNIIPEDTKESFKTSLSGGEWRKVNPDTGAAGIYQFTEERWNQLVELAPDLGLTEAGRTAKDASQQEKAMEWTIQDNTRGLIAYEIPVNKENLLGAHIFGFESFVSIHEASDNEKLTKVLGESASSPVFNGMNTVGEAKRYVNQLLNKGK